MDALANLECLRVVRLPEFDVCLIELSRLISDNVKGVSTPRLISC